MNILNITAGFVTAILGIAYPLLIQSFKDDYASDKIVKIFDDDKRNKYFVLSLKIQLIILLLFLIVINPYWEFFFSSNSFCFYKSSLFLNILFDLLLLISTSIFVILFFRFINLTKTFNRSSSLIQYLNKKVSQKDNYIDGIADILYRSIANQDTTQAHETSRIIYKLFNENRKNWKDDTQPLIYNQELYAIAINSAEKMVRLENNSLIFLEYRVFGGVWFFGENDIKRISNDTYYRMWYILSLAIEKNRRDLIFMNWKFAHQFFDYKLGAITPKYETNTDFNLTVTNQEDIELRNLDRERFLDFYCVIGAAVLYSNQYNLINSMFTYTQSEPARFPLLLGNFNQIFNYYFKFVDPFEFKYNFDLINFKFPGLDGMKAESVVKNNICSYIALLYIRLCQYKKELNPFDNLNLKEEIKELTYYKEYLDSFKKRVSNLKQNEQLMTTLSFKKELVNLTYFNELKRKVSEKIDRLKSNKPIEINKKEQFFKSSSKIMNAVFEKFKFLFNKEKNDNEFNIDSISGDYRLIEREDFLETGINNINFDSFWAEHLSYIYINKITQYFYKNSTIKYVIEENDLFNAIDELDVNEKFTIIGFGLDNLDYYKNNIKVNGLQNNKYNNLEIKLIPYPLNGLKCFIVFKTVDAPIFVFEKPSDELIELFELTSDDDKLFIGVSDLKDNQILSSKLKEQGFNVNNQVCINVYYQQTIYWKKEAKIVLLELKNNFDNLTKPININEIKKFEES